MHGVPLYSSMFLRPLRIAQRVGLIIAGVILLALITAAVILPTALTSSVGAAPAAITSEVKVLVVVIAVIGIGALVAVLLMAWQGTSLAMNVTTAGIEVRGYFRTRWIPWEQVQVIESSEHWYWRRATCIVTTGGERVLSLVTSYQYLYFRGDPHDELSRDPRVPQLPTRVTIDAHQRWLRGEFTQAR